MINRPLGKNQLHALGSLARLNSGTWTAQTEWRIGTLSNTLRVLDSLVCREFATCTTASGRYTVTEAGLNELGWYTCTDCGRLTRRPHIGHFLGTDRHKRCDACFELTTYGLCERCDGECTDFLPDRRIGAYHLKVSRTCLDVMCTEVNAAYAEAPVLIRGCLNGCP
ncbi:hypothetical protein ACIQVO_36635 [Streptomyces sp. NPDC101062]|uniref:hypothetical protein n=1 Tax=unclassified Streptomyces TaxID=2593676 RepID=UPI00382FFB02